MAKRIHKPGFTLNEVILVVAVFVLMSSLSIPYLGDFYRNQNVGTYCKGLRQALYRASYRAIAGERNSDWGVYTTTGNYTLYSGNSYATRSTQFDEVYDIPNTMSIGNSEIRFQIHTGIPSTTGTVSIQHQGTTTVCATVVETGLIDS